jgi:hypothetical protein
MRVVVANSHAQVYETRPYVIACLRSGRSRLQLGLTHESAVEAKCDAGACQLMQVALAGDVVAYALKGAGQHEMIVARSLATGRVLHEASFAVATAKRALVEEAHARRLVVNATGAIAWTQEDFFAAHGGSPSPPAVFDVFGLGSGGSRTFALDLPLQPRSLRLAGDRLSWTDEAQTHSAKLR